MKISVIIPTYNNLALLKKTLTSLEKQDIPFSDFEVLVIDDFSTDGTREYLQTFERPMKLRPLFNPENLGRAKTRNKGIFAAENELSVFLDSDREVYPNFLRLHRGAQKNSPQVSIGRMLFHPHLPRTRINKYLEKRGAYRRSPEENLPGRYFISCNSSIPTEILRSIGGFDENITHYGGEDLELGYRLAKIIPLRSLPQALDYHNHYRQFDDFFKIVYGYGKGSLPYIIKKHPQLYEELRLDKVPPKSLRDYLIALFCLNPAYNLIKILCKLEIVPDIFYSYMIFRNYRAGYRESLKNLNQ